LNKFQQSRRGAICAFPKPDCFHPEPRPQFFLIQSGELPKGVDSPFVEDSKDFCSVTLQSANSKLQAPKCHAANLRQTSLYVQANI
jgi:hypothetical protein